MIMARKCFQYINFILVSSLLVSQIQETICSTDCTHKKQGMEDGAITNDMITSSSSLEGHLAQEARPTSNTIGWIPETTKNAGQEWIQVKFPFAHLVTGIVTEWVYETDLSSFNASGEETQTMYHESFRIEYGPHESALLTTEELIILNSTKGEVQTTNIDPVYTRIFRIIPLSTTSQQIGLKFEILGCNQTSCQCPEDCYHVPQGMADRRIKTEQISIMYSRMMYSNNYNNVRLNDDYGLTRNKNFQWLQVTFDEIHIISGVITKGGYRYYSTDYFSTNYVETFDIELGLETDDLQRINQTFNGNTNRNTSVINIFEAQFSRIFRIIPLSTSSYYYGLRLEILGCYITKSCGCFVGNNNKLQGLMDGRISARQLSASSQYEMIDGYGPASARLQSHMNDQSFGCWVPNGMTNQWIQVEFSGTLLLTGVATQGCHSNYIGQWVYTFNIAVGFQGTALTTLDETFIGNSDANTVVVNVFTPVYANVMRLIPISTQSIFFGLRFDIYGCMIPDECTNNEFDVRIDNAGFIEIQLNGKDWGRACKDDINNHEADLVCQYLGYSRAKGHHHSSDSQFENKKFEIHCDNGDYALFQCEVTERSDCKHKYKTVECETCTYV
ncbi:neuropilin-1a-like isoform X2 [Anneissia japonica]|uniref:neuropilin-1a-like isoform X2 n=1 Tax=Anneissia japonica TaxID=1529436 RepID=UPI001425B2CC|nr:neuropilin-1a-like isoform X2 [Anneissia japonica]